MATLCGYPRISLFSRVFSGRILASRILSSSSSLLSVASQESPSSKRIRFARSRNMSSSKVGNSRLQAVATQDVATVGLTKPSEQALPEVELHVSEADPIKWSGDLLVVGVFEGGLSDEQGPVKELDAHLGGILGEIASEEDFSGKSGQTSFVRLSGQPFKRIGLVGLGKVEATPSLKAWRTIGESIAAAAKTTQASSVAVLLSALDQSESPSKVDAIVSLASGVLLGTFEDARFKSEYKKPALKKLEFLGVSSVPSLDDQLQVLVKVCAGVIRSKQLVNAPANVLTPCVLAEEALRIASEHSDVFTANILDEEQCKELKMGSYLGVAIASANPPKFIHLQYRPSSGDVKTKLAIVGKGLTFDSGGYNLKPTGSSIELMKYDMGGAAAALGAAKALGAIQPAGVEVHFIVAACENMISGAGMRPGDILTASNGKTIEVNNTDAEGRLTLADALVYACNQKVDKIVDLATLTGACVVALGNEIAGMFTPSDQLAEELTNASTKVGEKLWRMPMEEAYWDVMKSGIADMVNTGARAGGAITAALFLKQFVDEKIPWAHLDIAGPVWNEKKKAATGFAVATLVEWVLRHSS